jgi:5-methylcytosine-specific restriction endonuclease McrBC regulatory subunit McrC
MNIHAITEWGRLDIDDAGPPSVHDLILARQLRGQADELGSTEGAKLLLDWSYDGRLRVRARSWVGVVRVAGHEIRVVPKHTHGSLGVLTMLRYASGAIPEQIRSARTVQEGDRNLLDLVCLLLADQSEMVVRLTQAFLLDMNVLFERFIARALEDSASGTSFRVDRQSSTGSIIVDALTGRTYTRVRPDLLVRHGEHDDTYPVDTKYKLYDERHVAPEDIYQAFLYAFAFQTGHGPRQASLVYPSDRSEVNQHLAVRGSGITQGMIRGVRVNLSELVARAAVGPIVDPDLLMLCTGATNAHLSLLPAPA